MAKLISKQVTDFLDSLQFALRLSPEQSLQIVDEVRADLVAQVQRFVESGNDEETAVALALEEMGSPDELASHIRVSVPPRNVATVRLLRRSLTVLLSIERKITVRWFPRPLSGEGQGEGKKASVIYRSMLTLLLAWILWHLRADSYGFSTTRAIAISAVFLPITLLVWPSVIWRKNWMFSAIPSAAIFIIVTLLMSTGQSSATTSIVGPGTPAPASSFPVDPRNDVVTSDAGYIILGLVGDRMWIND